MGYILGNEYRRIIFLPPVIVLVATIMSFLALSGEKLEMLILNLYFFMLFFNTGVRKYTHIDCHRNHDPPA